MPQPGASLLEPEEEVLSTLNRDGSRRWLRPRLSRGRFLWARRWVAYFLIALFTVLPHITINGKPAVLLDLAAREFTLFGFTFLPTDTVLLALFMMALFVAIFLLTAILGRTWCGWACPQTVYLEFLYRPIERFFQGAPGMRSPIASIPLEVRVFLKLVVYLLVSLFVAHTFLAYFVGVDALWEWVQRSPFEHPASFLVMLVTTGLMMFDFTYFREQTCIVACPYGRFQSVMLDRDSLIISYDRERGEPRGKPSGAARRLPTLQGDCIDCGLCVDTCPTGIDIRDGLQLECVACSQCIDACDAVMDKIKKPRGLIRYGSQRSVEGVEGPKFRARLIFYPAVLVILVSAFCVVLFNMSTADVLLTRGRSSPFIRNPDGTVLNPLQLHITNRSTETQMYALHLLEPQGCTLSFDADALQLEPRGMLNETVVVTIPPEVLEAGENELKLRVTDAADFDETVGVRLLGPFKRGG